MALNWDGPYDRLFIGGQWTSPSTSDRIAVVSPVTETVLAEVPSGSTTDVDEAVAAARVAFDEGVWPRLAVGERVAVLKRFRDIFAARQSEIATLVSQEMGCPITQALLIQAAVPLAILDSALDLGSTYPFESIRSASTGSALVTKVPVGVVAAIVPWNVPLSVTMQKLGPALLAGCTFVLKPAPETPLSAYLLASMLQEAGVPEGVFNLVPAEREASEYLVAHPGVDKVAFTGSTAAGRKIAAVCGENLKKVTLELGGKSAALLLDDADFDSAVESFRMGSLRNSGQVCSLKTRIIVSSRREQELIDRLSSLVASMPVGDPADPETQIGPMVSQRQRDAVNNYIRIGLEEGAKPAMGGGESSQGSGWFVEPTIFTNVDAGMRIAQEEIFGPVLCVIAYDDEDEAVAIANDSEYGLNGAVFTADEQHGLQVAQRIRTGTVEINGSSAGLSAPMGGFKASGIGREGGTEVFDAYVESKAYGVTPEFAQALRAKLPQS